METIDPVDTMKEELLQGLSSEPKFIPSAYFYDEEGDKIFQQIMKMPEYYLTDCEYEIFSNQTAGLCKAFGNGHQPIDLIEFGCGDGFKTKVLLDFMMNNGSNFNYVPIDISANVLELLVSDLKQRFNGISCLPLNLEYFSALDEVSRHSSDPKVILFLGSSIGNFEWDEAAIFLRQLGQKMNAGDKLFIGFDLIKDPQVILDAYDDKAGITRTFNMNLLERMNRELGAKFDKASFKHYPFFDPEKGAALSYLVSLKDQQVDIPGLETSFHFNRWEFVKTEISQKYDMKSIQKLASETGFRVVDNFSDSRRFYMNSLWTVA